jgi:hypothetical protein
MSTTTSVITTLRREIDPVSMARFVGPECAGTSSPDIRWLINLSAEAT